jgi:hypothetical protein
VINPKKKSWNFASVNLPSLDNETGDVSIRNHMSNEPKPNIMPVEDDTFSFGPHFTCECCGDKMTNSYIALRLNKAFITRLIVEENPDYYATIKSLRASGWVKANICEKCWSR